MGNCSASYLLCKKEAKDVNPNLGDYKVEEPTNPSKSFIKYGSTTIDKSKSKPESTIIKNNSNRSKKNIPNKLKILQGRIKGYLFRKKFNSLKKGNINQNSSINHNTNYNSSL